VSAVFKPDDVQGNIVRGYRKARVRHLVLEITGRDAARRWLVARVSGRDDVTQITPETTWTAKPDTCFNIGVTYEGLRALGTPQAWLDTFPTEFIEGMNARALKLGDAGPSAPENWPAPFDKPKQIHLIATIYANELDLLQRVQDQALAGETGLELLGTREGWNFHGNDVHFGYRDNISQPRFPGIHEPDEHPDAQPLAPLGTVLLGYPTNFEGLTWRIPDPDVLGRNGTFNAFRVLEQDVVGFEEYLDSTATELLQHPHVDELLPPGKETTIGAGLSRHAALREIVAANMCGRWRNGVPLATSPATPEPAPDVKANLTNFDYAADSGCPYGAHVRRCNPRGGQIVQRVANHSRRLVRRGMPYGPPFKYDPAATNKEAERKQERGLLGNFIGANLGAQFEAMSCDWLNLGLQDPRITGSNDPIVGANEPETSWFDLPLKSGVIRLPGLPRFVLTRGGAYTFLPSIPAIRFLGSLTI
jgi:deferrochelatase/peroxidase EfeB